MKFLVVDDSTTMRRIICNALREIGYSDVVEAGDGQEALDKLKLGPVDFVLTDWNMPNMNGLALLRSIRTHPEYQGLPVVLITTRGMQEDVVAAMFAQASNYIVKPFTPHTLQSKIDSVLKAA